MHEKDRSSTRLIILCGLSFAGKSTLANALCAAFGLPQVDVDETKEALYGPGVADKDLNSAAWTRIYRETDDRMVAYLRSGSSVVDASRNFCRRERNHARVLAAGVDAEVVLVHVDTPEALVRQRWAENRAKQTRRDVSDKGFEEIISVMEPPTTDEVALVFHHDDDIARWLARHAEHLAGKPLYTGTRRKDMEPILTRCGYRCDLCLAYRPNVEKNPSNQQKLSDGWFKYFGFRLPPETILCDGCMAENPKLIDSACPVRPCVMEKGLDNCAQCEQYVCKKLTERLVVYEEIKKRINAEIPDDDYHCFIRAYENKKRLDALRAAK